MKIILYVVLITTIMLGSNIEDQLLKRITLVKEIKSSNDDFTRKEKLDSWFKITKELRTYNPVEATEYCIGKNENKRDYCVNLYNGSTPLVRLTKYSHDGKELNIKEMYQQYDYTVDLELRDAINNYFKRIGLTCLVYEYIDVRYIYVKEVKSFFVYLNDIRLNETYNQRLKPMSIVDIEKLREVKRKKGMNNRSLDKTSNIEDPKEQLETPKLPMPSTPSPELRPEPKKKKWWEKGADKLEAKAMDKIKDKATDKIADVLLKMF